MRTTLAALAAVLAPLAATGQEPPKPGPEHEVLKKHVGTWDIVMKMAGTESKGTVTAEMDLGGLWLNTRLESEMLGMKYSGRGLDTYDPTSKKYRALWADNFSTAPVMFEGTYDADKKTLSMTGTGPGPDGPATKFTSTTEFQDADTMLFTMKMGAETFTISYKRKK